MNIGYSVFKRIDGVREHAAKLGFTLDASPAFNYSTVDEISVYPMDDNFPVYCRGVAIFTGGLADVEGFLQGVSFYKDYLRMIKAVTDQTIERKEQDCRNAALVRKIKGEPESKLKN